MKKKKKRMILIGLIVLLFLLCEPFLDLPYDIGHRLFRVASQLVQELQFTRAEEDLQMY